MKIKKLRVGPWPEEKCSMPCHFIVMVIIALWRKLDRKVHFKEWVSAPAGRNNFLYNTFGELNLVWVISVSCVGNNNIFRIYQNELVKFLGFFCRCSGCQWKNEEWFFFTSWTSWSYSGIVLWFVRKRWSTIGFKK